MSPELITMLISISVPLVVGFVGYGKLQGEVKSMGDKIKDAEGRIRDARDNLQDKLAAQKETQNERDRRQDARTSAIENKLETHSSDLSDMKVVLARVDTNLDHLVKALEKNSQD